MATWNVATCKGGLGFILFDSNANICFVGYSPSQYDGTMEIESKALCLALRQSRDILGKCSYIYIYISSVCLWKAIHGMEEQTHWNQLEAIDNLKEFLQQMNHPRLSLSHTSGTVLQLLLLLLGMASIHPNYLSFIWAWRNQCG